jgi:D-2-hydroxyacid dehydrogenase (NADP+)
MKNPHHTSRRKFIIKSLQNGALIGGGSILPFSGFAAKEPETKPSVNAPRLPLNIWLSTNMVDENEEKIKKTSPEINLIKNLDQASKNELLPTIDVVFGHISEDDLKKADRLKWVHSSSAGVEKQLFPAMMERSEIVMSQCQRMLWAGNRRTRFRAVIFLDKRYKRANAQYVFRKLAGGGPAS